MAVSFGGAGDTADGLGLVMPSPAKKSLGEMKILGAVAQCQRGSQNQELARQLMAVDGCSQGFSGFCCSNFSLCQQVCLMSNWGHRMTSKGNSSLSFQVFSALCSMIGPVAFCFAGYFVILVLRPLTSTQDLEKRIQHHKRGHNSKNCSQSRSSFGQKWSCFCRDSSTFTHFLQYLFWKKHP